MNRIFQEVTEEGGIEGGPGPNLALLRLLWRLDHVREVQSRGLEERLGLTSRQRTVLRLIGRYPGISPGQISQMLHLHPSRLTSLLRPLMRRGLVLRSCDPRDQRRHRLGLSTAGMALDVPHDGTLEAALQEAASRVSLQELESAQEVLACLIEHIDTR